jgi:hypothetical protein
MYEGKEICQGCGKTGAEKPRYRKSELCKDCENQLKIGRARQHEDHIEYVRICQFMHAYSSLDFHDKRLNRIIYDLVNSLNNESAEYNSNDAIKTYFGDNVYWATIPKSFLEPLQVFGESMNKYVMELRKEKDNLPKLAKEEVAKEKDRIYNEGVKKGRDLLFQLNNGELTIDDINKKRSYHG